MSEKVKVVAMSDLHGYLPPKDSLPKCDIVCIAGDIMPLEVQSDSVKSLSWFLLDFRPWADSLDCEKVLFVAGNHDFLFQWIGPDQKHSGAEVMKKCFGQHKKETKLVYLQDSSFEYKSKRFYGSPWIADLERWAFYKSEEDLQQQWSTIPKRCDVLITHMPPKCYGFGQVQETCWNHAQDYGSQLLAEIVSVRDIKHHIFGHVHSGQHTPMEVNGTTMANVSIKNEDYKVKYYPYEFEV